MRTSFTIPFFRGAARQFKSLDTPDLRVRQGINEDHWAIFTQPSHWAPADTPHVRSVADAYFSGAMYLAGLPDQPRILAEEAAFLIAEAVWPPNWPAAVYLVRQNVDGSRIVIDGLTDPAEFVPVSQAVLYSYVLLCHETDVMSLRLTYPGVER